MKIAGLSGKQAAALTSGEWYLLHVDGATVRGDNGKRRLEVNFTVEEGESAGLPFTDDFYLTAKAISRVRCFLSRAAYPEELIEQDELEPNKIIGLSVWAKVKDEEYNGQKIVKTDGWNFRSKDDPPEQEVVIDHTKEVQQEEDF